MELLQTRTERKREVTDEIEYKELTSRDVSREMVHDLNQLLPQLSSNAKPITEEWLDYVFVSGTRIFAALDNGQFDGRIIGTVLLAPMVILVGQKDWIEDVIVDKAYRRRGISSRLMDMAEEASAARQAKHVNLTSTPDKGPARKMYEDRGYVLRNTGVFRRTPGS